jgi:hypothetical protein
MPTPPRAGLGLTAAVDHAIAELARRGSGSASGSGAAPAEGHVLLIVDRPAQAFCRAQRLRGLLGGRAVSVCAQRGAPARLTGRLA